ncbi:unnamed protein product [Caenorhabditis bovis]|uniref:Methyltransferase FkbM domain-containing protein n=1 Tax=Caenorhabditis bovis TaxID=2654633 RepID=A0A8S1F925_9PELO|nr:unnamed protein product [Caenorhabditis bovis]
MSKWFARQLKCKSAQCTVCTPHGQQPFEYWRTFAERSQYCDKFANSHQLHLIALANRDETKYAILPHSNDTDNTLVTLGIGNDIGAELALRQAFGANANSLRFFGADPIVEANRELYSRIGQYFPFAVAAQSGVSTASVLVQDAYQNRDVVHVVIVYFLKAILNRTIIDHLWLDAEYAEYTMLDVFYRGGRFDANGITVCQWSCENSSGDANTSLPFTATDARCACVRFVVLAATHTPKVASSISSHCWQKSLIAKDVFVIVTKSHSASWNKLEKRPPPMMAISAFHSTNGMRMNSSRLLLALPLVLLFLYLYYAKQASNARVPLFDEWNECISTELRNLSDAAQFWRKFQHRADRCDEMAQIERLGIVHLRNLDEIKYALLPVGTQANRQNVLVTLGIGNDINSEVQLQKKMTDFGHDVTFYGADPIIENNRELYQKIGQFFPFAVGGDAGYSTASVMINNTYMNHDVVHVDIIYFLDKILKVKTIDHLWLDAEGAEYGFLDIFFKGGRLDQHGITFCQMSLEVHNPNDDQKAQFMDFIRRIVEEKRYAFFKSLEIGHMRMWLFNFDNDYCVQKFVAKDLVTK